MHQIQDLESLKLFLKTNLKNPIVGIGVYAFNRLGLEDIISDYHLVALRYSLDTKLIEKNIETLSLEKGMGTKHIKDSRNSTTIIDHPRVLQYLKKLTDEYKQPPVLLVYKSTNRMEKICQDNLWILTAPQKKFGKALFENKARLRKMLEDIHVSIAPGEIKIAKELDYNQLSDKYGLPFVLQHPTRGGGKGTFFIHNQNDFEKAISKLKNKENDQEKFIKEKNSEYLNIVVSKFIKGPSPSITGCVTKHGILSTGLQHQILDIDKLYNSKNGSGLFCGHDWSFSNFSDKINQQAYEIVERIGELFKKWNYKGIFGLDFILDEKEEKLYVIESNPRMLGSFPTLSMAQLMNNEPPILAFHLLEHININYSIDINKINNLMRKKKQGAHMFLHNLTKSWARNHNVVQPGVYILNRNKLEFLRPGYKLQHLKNQEEFLITEGVPIRKSHFSPNRRLCRILTLAPVLEEYDRLNPWAERVIKTTYKAFKMRPILFADIRKIFNPDFIAKG
ncbi:ATP-grasp domain-containing protein [Patescibacteria group bacterium]